MSPVEQFSALADPTRLRVVELLGSKARPVHELAAAFAISRPAISRHLRVLKEAGLVREERRGRENVYTLQRQRLKPMLDWLQKQREKPEAPAGRKAKRIVAKVAKAPIAVVPAAKPRVVRPVKVAPPPEPALPQLSLDF